MDKCELIFNGDVFVKGAIFAEKDVHSNYSLDKKRINGFKSSLAGGLLIGIIILWPVIVCTVFWTFPW
jgi:hypothetical protein